MDVGVKQDGLVHISHLSNRFITDPNEAVKLNQQVMVTVLDVDVARKRISLSIKEGMDKSSSNQSSDNKNSKTSEQKTRTRKPIPGKTDGDEEKIPGLILYLLN